MRRFTKVGTEAVESCDVLSVNAFISKDYSDTSGRKHRDLRALVADYFLRNRNIHLLTRISDIHLPVANRAEGTAFVGMAGSPVSGVEALLNLRADLFRFDLTLVRDGEDWLLKGAKECYRNSFPMWR